MRDALIGWSGFVGSSLRAQGATFDDQFRSVDIEQIVGRSYRQVTCAGASAEKWRANQFPDEDKAKLHRLMDALDRIVCERFVLISTVDVYAHPVDVDEASPPDPAGLHAYGKHRLALEQFVRQRFANVLIVRLPGLVGPGLKKNLIYDLKHRNLVDRIDPAAKQQIYPMSRLAADLAMATRSGFPVVHLVAEPLSAGRIAAEVFGTPLVPKPEATPSNYDVRTLYASYFGKSGPWQYNADESLAAIRTYAAQPMETLP